MSEEMTKDKEIFGKSKLSVKIFGKMLKNPKIKKAMEGILSPLEQEGDSLTIKIGDTKDDRN